MYDILEVLFFHTGTEENGKALAALREVLVPEEVLQLLLQDAGGQVLRGHEGLSNREYQVLVLLGSGKNGVAVARAMSISVKTVASHRRRVLDKLGLSSTGDLIHYAVINRLVQH